ncbi:MAG: Stk1 family PASTA domain-containing Ser/Thr kinase [Hamadaea sp.]|uniref:Stk1 family PASTA domain-containing Ser/Thr kinase n=1 Tax=Hamadaea sp. TaxID=2024425 RepID=UPI00178DFE91|nr:Stk1 family PASTA domain-containing Ser/Thr kinase [Hamadaea sp.]NUT21158.1 Stk1 family PASTA domain-containing Ser/Thr kinase [Hamadaea sp.]
MTQARLLGGRYQVGELLGYGGMAEVHRGRDLRLGRDVAIKMLRTDLARDNTFQMRFRREAQNAAALNHPAIVAVYDTGEERAPTGEALPYIVMEFVPGRTLKEVLAAEGRLMPRRALEITGDICAAIEFSHRHGIIHRDIKPGNVMLTPQGQVKVMDFGIARALASGATTMTQTSAVIGTAQYLSPEQARGEAVDARSDVYATGCVLFELLCGHPPFVGDSPVAVAYQHVREDPPPPSNSNRDVTPDIDAVVLKALAKNPANRYQSAAEMRADVLRAAAGRPVLATPVLREDETLPLNASTARTAARNGARVGTPKRKKTSGAVIALLSFLGVLAVIAVTVGLVLLNQPKRIGVPSVLGKTYAEAQSELTALGFKTSPGEPVTNDTCDKDKVADQTPKGGQKADANSTVTLRVCTGPGQVQVPSLDGLTKTSAESLLTQFGLKAEFKPVDSDKPVDSVLSYTPGKGTTVEKNSTVVVQISKGNKVVVPNVVGMKETEACAKLKEAGLTCSIADGKAVTDPAKADLVSSQSVKKDSLVERNSTVTIKVDYLEDTNPTGTPSPTTSPS